MHCKRSVNALMRALKFLEFGRVATDGRTPIRVSASSYVMSLLLVCILIRPAADFRTLVTDMQRCRGYTEPLISSILVTTVGHE